MPGDTEFEFDMGSALDSMSDGLGFETPEAPDSDKVIDDAVTSTASDLGTEKTTEVTQTTAPAQEPPPSDPSAIPEAPPKTWRAEALSTWASIPPLARQEILKREDDIMKGLDAYKSDAAFAKPLKAALAPFLPVLQQHGIDPATQISGLMRAHQTLALGTPEEKSSLFLQLASDYGVDLAALSASAPYQDPAVAALQAELRTLKTTLTQAEQSRRATAQAEMERTVSAFASDPAHPHFEAVAADMTALLQSGACKTLQEAYDKAIWVNPISREAELSRQQAEASAKLEKEKAERVAKAKAASAANLRTRAKSGRDTAPTGSIDDTLNAVLAEIQARDQ